MRDSCSAPGRGAVCQRCGRLPHGSEAYLVEAAVATIKLGATVVRGRRVVVHCVPCGER